MLRKIHYAIGSVCGIAMFLVVFFAPVRGIGDWRGYMSGVTCCVATYLLSKFILLFEEDGDK